MRQASTIVVAMMLAAGFLSGCSANSAPSKPSPPAAAAAEKDQAHKPRRTASFAQAQKRYDEAAKRDHLNERFAERQKRYQDVADEAERADAAANKNP